ncbi:MAG: AbrB/MazE/SpoVT family DNA-binding domain-containing protein [Candidatus Omnitrophica bacterium]|nr:AbrB/MazE/SpoVT family DNA-binding domain-containing protein [Candidatus Omnitrophota bacterium]
MHSITVSPKFQVVIPLEVRQSLGIQPGEKCQILQYENRIELIPVKKIRAMRGFLKGIDTAIAREPDRV